MNLARSLRPARFNSTLHLFRSYKVSSTSNESTQASQPQVTEEKFDFEDIVTVERAERRKASIPPFMKEVFVSIFNKELLAYPEILNKEETDDLDRRVILLDSVFKNEDKTQNDRIDALKRTNLFGAPIKLTKGGLALNVTERIRYLETVSSDLKLAKMLSDHWTGLSVLEHGLHENQLNNIRSDLMSGDQVITVCVKEPLASRLSQSDFRAVAKMDHDGVWKIHAEKVCYNNSGYFLVAATVDEKRLKAFLVHPNAEGVNYMHPYIAFRDTPATILDDISDDQLSKILALSRMDKAVVNYSLLKQMIMKTMDFTLGKYILGKPLSVITTFRAKFGDALLALYAAESMAYFTAGLLDGYLEPDADLELAMCRTFSCEHGMKSMIKLLNIPGLDGVDDDWNDMLNQFRRLTVQDESFESLNVFIALSGLQHAGKIMSQEVKQMRNPIMYPTYILKKVFNDRHQENDNPKMTLNLDYHLHPTLKPAAAHLEYCVARLRFACETILARHGVEITGAHTELERLAMAATEVFAMTSVLARASRSYCIGVRNAEVEMKLAACFVEESKLRTQKLINDLVDGEYLNLDIHKISFGRKMLDTKSVLVEKATERVFW